jgi:hypothetical protein
MRQQTSLEFLIIAGAIGVLVLFAIVQYGSIVKQYKNATNVSLGNYSVPGNPVYYQRPFLEASIPAVSSPDYQNELAVAAYGCSNGTVSISLNSASIGFSANNITQRFYNVWTYEDGFTPSPGPNKVYLTYEILCDGSTYNGSESLSTVYSQAGTQLPYSAYLSERNESVNYGIQKQKVLSLSVSSHCTLENFFFTPYPIQFQCSSTNAWQYRVSSSLCSSNGGPLTETVCIVPQESGYNISTTSQYQTGYDYSANLAITGVYTLNSRISSANRESAVYYDGEAVGNVTVENVSSEQINPGVVLVYGQKTGYVNYTYLSGYEQAENNLYDLLAYYNSSEISADLASEIQQELAAYDYSEARLIAAANSTAQIHCSMNGSITCPARYPFYYIINATISPKYVYQNQTLSYEGSIIRVFN